MLFRSLVVVVGLGRMPFGYYALLRATLCLVAAVGFAAARRANAWSWVWFYGVAAVLQNPLLPLRLGSKSMWILLDIATLVLFWIGALRFRREVQAT